MAIPIQGYSIVAKVEHIEPLFKAHSLAPPNSTAVADGHLWVCSFMMEEDAVSFAHSLRELRLNVDQGPDPDAVLVSEFDESMHPYCEWLRIGKRERAVIGWKFDTDPETVVAPEGWDPKAGSGLTFYDPSKVGNLQFLRYEDNVAVYFATDLGKEVYVAQRHAPIDPMFQVASDVIVANLVSAGEPPLAGKAAKDVADAVETLRKVIVEEPNWWNALFFYGKGCLALGRNEEAYAVFTRAFELEKDVEFLPRELAGSCLLLQKYDEAVVASEKAAALLPEKADALGNLALSYLMAGRIDAAKTTIGSALKIDRSDKINLHLKRVIQEVADGNRKQPATMEDVSKSTEQKKKPFWRFW